MKFLYSCTRTGNQFLSFKFFRIGVFVCVAQKQTKKYLNYT